MSNSEQTVAFIGLGNMGAPMVANLCSKGFAVRAYDVSAEALQKAVAAGCVATDSAVAAVTGADVVVTMLPNGDIVEGLLIDEQRILESMQKGALLIDCSTVAASSSLRVHERADSLGVLCLDAPVSGGVGAAKAGTLAFMCGGTEQALRRPKRCWAPWGLIYFVPVTPGQGKPRRSATTCY